jgi:hypothetical protein
MNYVNELCEPIGRRRKNNSEKAQKTFFFGLFQLFKAAFVQIYALCKLDLLIMETFWAYSYPIDYICPKCGGEGAVLGV